MKMVYIVRGGYHYEFGSTSIKGFRSREAAERYANTIPTGWDDSWDYVFIEEIEIAE